jgi:hypothetical protein
MDYEELKKAIAALLPADTNFQLKYGTGYRGTYSLDLNGQSFCFAEFPEKILWAIGHQEEHRQKQKADLDDLLQDLASLDLLQTTPGGSNEAIQE